jgi:hypothetical protein
MGRVAGRFARRPERVTAFVGRFPDPVAGMMLPTQARKEPCTEDVVLYRINSHYEISRYDTLRTWAGELGLDKAVELLETTLREEKETDETLTELAESVVNAEAEAAQPA